MAKKMPKNCQCQYFLPFLGPLQAIKTSPNYFFSCRGGSKLRFSGSYVKIGQELASEMSF